MKKNTSRVGFIGENLTLLDLLKRGYNLYKPCIDDDGVDFVVETKKKDKFITLQVKYSKYYDSYSSICLDIKKPCRADYIAFVCKDENNKDLILYMKNKRNKRCTRNIQITKSKNNQKKGIHNYKSYLIPRF